MVRILELSSLLKDGRASRKELEEGLIPHRAPRLRLPPDAHFVRVRIDSLRAGTDDLSVRFTGRDLKAGCGVRMGLRRGAEGSFRSLREVGGEWDWDRVGKGSVVTDREEEGFGEERGAGSVGRALGVRGIDVARSGTWRGRRMGALRSKEAVDVNWHAHPLLRRSREGPPQGLWKLTKCCMIPGSLPHVLRQKWHWNPSAVLVNGGPIIGGARGPPWRVDRRRRGGDC